MAKVSIDVNIISDEENLEDTLDDVSLQDLVSVLNDAIVEVVNAKEGIYGTVNTYLNGEQESSVNFD